jgi:sortase A
MSKKEIIRFLILRTIGNFLVLFAIFGIAATFGPALYYEISFRIAEARGIRYEVASVPSTSVIIPTPILGKSQTTPTPTPVKSLGVDNFAQVLSGPKVQILTPVDTQFSIIIPRIGASAKVYPNVDPSKESYFLPVLAKGVAHAKGTVFPGQKGNIYLFAHSTDNFWDVGRYNAVFYLIKDLNPGDKVVIFFQNKRYNYVVKNTKIVSPSEVSYLVNAQKSGKEQLILQTCWPPGTTFQRLLVFAEPE